MKDRERAEEKLIHYARSGMLKFNISQFKKTHPHLFSTIINAMIAFRNEGLKEELIKYLEWRELNDPYSAVIAFDKHIDRYLSTKQ